jgi:hypothetical protein
MNPNTLLPQFLGMYRVKLYHLRRNVKFVIMNSVYYTDKYLQEFYDLKGSELGRSAKPGQDVKKDNDLRQKMPGEALSLTPDVRSRVRAQIRTDCDFLQSMQIMDYSLLVGIHHIPPKQKDAPGNIAKTGFRIGNDRASKKLSLVPGAGGGDPNKQTTWDERSHGSHSQDGGNRASLSLEENAGSKLADYQKDSTKKLIMDIRDGNYAHTDIGLLEEDDDFSYLEGSHPHETHVSGQTPRIDLRKIDDIEMKKEQTIEQIYWPFHRFYDINGLRQMKPKPCFRCDQYPCMCDGHQRLIEEWKIPDFVPPLSNRKDGGFMMDTTGLEMPMKFKTPNGDLLHEGKIFYIGIIDILQQYNVRKRAETGFRKIDSFASQVEPSCVSPDYYADRFLRFFDEYSQQCVPVKKVGKQPTVNEENTSIELSVVRGKRVSVDVHDAIKEKK